MRQRVIRTSLFVVVAGAMVVGFQNCAKVKDLQTLESSSELADAGSAPTGNGGGGGGGSTVGSGGGGSTTLTPREKAYKDCEEAKASATNVSEFVDLMNYAGNRTIRVQNLGIVSNYTGNLTVIGASDQNTARMLKDSVGNYLFCNMDLTAIHNFKSGGITVVGGDIGSIDGSNGNINVYGGRITGSVLNTNGNISEEP